MHHKIVYSRKSEPDTLKIHISPKITIAKNQRTVEQIENRRNQLNLHSTTFQLPPSQTNLNHHHKHIGLAPRKRIENVKHHPKHSSPHTRKPMTLKKQPLPKSLMRHQLLHPLNFTLDTLKNHTSPKKRMQA